MNRAVGDSHPVFTPRQGQYLAFIHAYRLGAGAPPAQADIQRFFRVTPPSVHQMLLVLERDGLISRRPGIARSIAVLVERADLYQPSETLTLPGAGNRSSTSIRYPQGRAAARGGSNGQTACSHTHGGTRGRASRFFVSQQHPAP